MGPARTGQGIIFLIASCICASSAGTNERGIEWMTQIAEFLEPISASVGAECRNHTLEYLQASKNLSNYWAISSSYFHYIKRVL